VKSSTCASVTARSTPVNSGRSTSTLSSPCAWRRRPNGSREPVGFSPALNSDTSVSALSAIDTAAHTVEALPSCARVGGASASTLCGR
jgi:hypothetical protein